MKELALKYQLLAELFRSLEVEGFVFGVEKHLQIQQLLAQLSTDITVEAYASIFAPLLCTTEKEQYRFYEIFAESLERVKVINEPVEDTSISILDPSRQYIKWLWLLGLPVLIAIGFLIYQTTKYIVIKRPAKLQNISFTVSPDSTNTKRIPKDELIDFAPIIRLGMGVDSLQQELTTGFGHYTVKDTLSIEFNAGSLEGQDSIFVYLYDSLGHCATVLLYAHIEKTAPEIAVEKIDSVTTAAYTPRFKPIDKYPHPNDIRSLEVEQTTGLEAFIAKNIYWLKPLFLLLAALLFWVIIKYRESKRRKLIVELESNVKPPYIWNINILNVENIVLGEDYYNVLSKLRQRTIDEYSRLDIGGTIKATIQNAGMANFRYREMTRPPEYLLLIDQQSESNHHAKLFDYLYRTFREEEIFIERFFFDGDPRLCYNETYLDGIALKELQYNFYNARLLLISNGYSLLSPLSGKLAKWTRLFNPWKQQALLSPQSIADWGYREDQLEELFHVLPASLQGLDFLVGQLDAGENANFDEWVNKVTDAPYHTITLERGLIPSLEQYYQPELICWIAGCAVYPSLHWDLTLYIGQLLTSSTKLLLSVDNLMQLNRLPWMIEGNIPPQARTVLVAWLEEHYPDTLLLIREHLQDILQKNQPPLDSIAWEDYSMNIALNEWLITKNKQRKKELEQEIAQKLEAGIKADFTVIKYLDRERTPLDFTVPNSWKKYIHKGGRSGLGWKSIWKDVWMAFILWLVLLVGIVGYQPNEICDGEIVEDLPFIEQGKALCINSEEERILLNEWLVREAIKEGRFQVADSLISKVVELEALARVSPELIIQPSSKTSINQLVKQFRENIATDYYNIGLVFGNRTDSLLYTQDTLYRNFREKTCNYYFNVAYRLDSLTKEIRNGHSWCINPFVIYTVANFDIKNENCCAPCRLKVENLSRDANNYFWDFGNGEISNKVQPASITYSEPGVYSIQLISENIQSKDTIIKIINICDSKEDSDGDGIPNILDACPQIAGKSENGCPASPKLTKLEVQQEIQRIFNEKIFEIRQNEQDTSNTEIVDLAFRELEEVKSKIPIIIETKSKITDNPYIKEFDNFLSELVLNRNQLTEDNLFVSIKTYDYHDNSPLYNCTVTIYQPDVDFPSEMYSVQNENNNVFSSFLQPDKNYKITIERIGYESYIDTISTKNISQNSKKQIIKSNFFLERTNFDDFLPLLIYFDQKDINELNSNNMSLADEQLTYISNQGKYKQHYTESMTGVERYVQSERFDIFFDREVNQGYKRFNKFLPKLLAFLKTENEVNISLRGSTNPRGSDKENEKISLYYIETVIEHIKAYDNGVFKTYLDSGALQIELDNYGETRSPAHISDNFNDERESIYSISASLERRVEIISISTSRKN